MSGTTGSLGVVAGRPVPARLLDDRIAELRAGPQAHLLPPDGCAEGRRLRRWLAQLILTEELIRAEAARLGVAEPDQDAHCGHGGWSSAVVPLTGSLASAVVAAMPLARLVYQRVTESVRVDEACARDFHRRNPDLWKRPEKRTLRYLVSAVPPDPDRLRADGTRLTCTRGDLPEPLGQLAFSATPGAIVGPVNTPFGWQVCLIERITPAQHPHFDTIRDEILGRLTRSARQRYFERWIERRRAALVVVAAGCEHPGDPRHSDYAHHH